MAMPFEDQVIIANARNAIDNLERGSPDPRGGWEDALSEFDRRRLRVFIAGKEPVDRKQETLEGIVAAVSLLELRLAELKELLSVE